MKKQGILNQPISKVIAGMGHGDMLVIADCGLPIPPKVPRIDLALAPGLPGFLETLAVILQELQVEKAIIASEMQTVSPVIYGKLEESLADLPLSSVEHEGFKQLTKEAVAVVRTGECTPYANIILKSGVIF